jgi:colanic acid biosynthesis protein WcaH
MRTLRRAAAGHPAGLPEEIFLFVSSLTPLVNVDLLVRDEAGRTLLTWREDEFYGAGWHVPGGIIRHGETLEGRLQSTAWEELGAEIEFDPVPVTIDQTIHPTRGARGHFVSLLYRCRLRTPPDGARRVTTQPVLPGQWAWHQHCPANLIPDQENYRCFL